MTTQGEGRRTTAYRITTAGARALRAWIDESRVGFPTLKHTVLLRLLIGHASEPGRMQEMLEEYVAELTEARARPAPGRESLAAPMRRASRSTTRRWSPTGALDYFAAETRHTRRALARVWPPR